MRLFSALTLLSLALTASIASATPYCQPCPLSCGDLGLGRKDCSEVSESRGVCCVDLSSKGMAVAKAQEQVLQGRQSAAVSCPAGFSPSEQRCSDSERRRGCRDQRVGPNRMGCVTTGFR